jgi:hypothetical protein
MKYRKKPVVIDAMQWTGKNTDEAMAFCLTKSSVARSYDNCLFIETREGEMRASVGDWIIRGVKGEHYPCKPDIFAETYEKVEDNE